jgi:putative ABC transport system permease protein
MHEMKVKVPKIPYWLLKKMAIFSIHEGYSGDIEEEYDEVVKHKGRRKAILWIWYHAMIVVPGALLSYVNWGGTMFKNYFKIALRNIKKHKSYSLINISSFAIGLSCCILILLYIKYEFSFDKYHDEAQNIYRVVREYQGESDWYNSSEHPLAASLKEDFPEVAKATRVKKNDEVGVVEYKSKIFNEEGIYFVDQDLLEIFTFPFISGDMHTALNEPFSIVITEEMAQKYFGSNNPVGEIIRIQEWYGESKFDYKILILHLIF